MSLKSRILLLNSWEAPTYAKCLLFSCLLALLSLELLIRSRLTASFKEQQTEAADQHFFLHFISPTVLEQLGLNPGYHSPQAHTNQYEVSDMFVDGKKRENCSNITCSLCKLEILASLQGVSKRGTQLQRYSDFKSGPSFWNNLYCRFGSSLLQLLAFRTLIPRCWAAHFNCISFSEKLSPYPLYRPSAPEMG